MAMIGIYSSEKYNEIKIYHMAIYISSNMENIRFIHTSKISHNYSISYPHRKWQKSIF